MILHPRNCKNQKTMLVYSFFDKYKNVGLEVQHSSKQWKFGGQKQGIKDNKITI